MKKIYVLGNKGFEEDSLPLNIMDNLQVKFYDKGIEFIHVDPMEFFTDENDEEDLILIDTDVNTSVVRVLEDIDMIESTPNVSLHDFDLGTTLKIMKKLGKLKSVKIICVPQYFEGIDEGKILDDICEKIEEIMKSN
ncbi:hypothetical protein COU57_00135 [Candidatus Pacearchaeota archaeon CG10_big_fil_rev_8_21_14_0_10_32_14]|nr:MAG: hypothetical protein COU57_00135 [Candidatus Pacearchaeota archaeon CG10_big_fil_rev_8_21_14_0_10_32_14]